MLNLLYSSVKTQRYNPPLGSFRKGSQWNIYSFYLDPRSIPKNESNQQDGVPGPVLKSSNNPFLTALTPG